MNDTTFSGNGKVSFVPVITNTNPQPQTNADRIRAMTDEELAWLLCHNGWFIESHALDWLKSQVKDG